MKLSNAVEGKSYFHSVKGLKRFRKLPATFCTVLCPELVGGAMNVLAGNIYPVCMQLGTRH